MSLMGQWADELADKAKGRLRVLLHHGPKRSRDPKDLAANDIVLVTYQTLGLEYSRGLKETSGDAKNLFLPCGSIQWHRIVLDEAHTVKNPNAQLTKACMALAGNKRSVSCLTQPASLSDTCMCRDIRNAGLGVASCEQ